MSEPQGKSAPPPNSAEALAMKAAQTLREAGTLWGAGHDLSKQAEIIQRIIDLPALLAAREERDRLRIQKPWTCPVCWYSAYVPVPTEAECDLIHPHQEGLLQAEHARCDYCWLKAQMEQREAAERERDALQAQVRELRDVVEAVNDPIGYQRQHGRFDGDWIRQKVRAALAATAPAKEEGQMGTCNNRNVKNGPLHARSAYCVDWVPAPEPGEKEGE